MDHSVSCMAPKLAASPLGVGGPAEQRGAHIDTCARAVPPWPGPEKGRGRALTDPEHGDGRLGRLLGALLDLLLRLAHLGLLHLGELGVAAALLECLRLLHWEGREAGQRSILSLGAEVRERRTRGEEAAPPATFPQRRRGSNWTASDVPL